VKAIAKIFFAVLTLGVPVYFGLRGLSILAPIFWAVLMMAFAVGTGWRHSGAGLFKSGLLALSYTLVAFIPLYYLGLWFS